MTRTQQWLIGQLGVLVAFLGFIAQTLVQKGTAAVGLPWDQTGAEGWVFWAFSVAAIGTTIQLVRFFQGEIDLSCHRMPGRVDRWIYPILAAVGPLSAVASLTLLALEMS